MHNKNNNNSNNTCNNKNNLEDSAIILQLNMHDKIFHFEILENLMK